MQASSRSARSTMHYTLLRYISLQHAVSFVIRVATNCRVGGMQILKSLCSDVHHPISRGMKMKMMKYNE